MHRNILVFFIVVIAICHQATLDKEAVKRYQTFAKRNIHRERRGGFSHGFQLNLPFLTAHGNVSLNHDVNGNGQGNGQINSMGGGPGNGNGQISSLGGGQGNGNGNGQISSLGGGQGNGQGNGNGNGNGQLSSIGGGQGNGNGQISSTNQGGGLSSILNQTLGSLNGGGGQLQNLLKLISGGSTGGGSNSLLNLLLPLIGGPLLILSHGSNGHGTPGSGSFNLNGLLGKLSNSGPMSNLSSVGNGSPLSLLNGSNGQGQQNSIGQLLHLISNSGNHGGNLNSLLNLLGPLIGSPLLVLPLISGGHLPQGSFNLPIGILGNLSNSNTASGKGNSISNIGNLLKLSNLGGQPGQITSMHTLLGNLSNLGSISGHQSGKPISSLGGILPNVSNSGSKGSGSPPLNSGLNGIFGNSPNILKGISAALTVPLTAILASPLALSSGIPSGSIKPGSPIIAPGSQISGHGSPIVVPGSPVSGHGSPITAPGSPVSEHGSPITVPGSPVSGHGSPITVPGSPVSGHGSPITVTGSPLSGHGSPITVPGSPVSGHGSPITVPGSPVSGHGSPITVPGSPVSGLGSPGNTNQINALLNSLQQHANSPIQSISSPVTGSPNIIKESTLPLVGLLNSPEALIQAISGSTGAILATLLGSATLPLTASGQIVKSILNGASTNPSIPNSSPLTGVINNLLNSPEALLNTISGASFGLVQDLLGSLTAPIVISGSLADNIFNGLSKNSGKPVSGLPATSFQHILPLLGSPAIILQGLSTGLSEILLTITGLAASPLVISGDLFEHALNINSLQQSGQPSIPGGINSANQASNLAVSLPMLILKGISGDVVNVLQDITALLTSPLPVSGQILNTIANSAQRIPNGLFTPSAAGITGLLTSPVILVKGLSSALEFAISGLLNVGTSPLRLFSGNQNLCPCKD